MKRKRGSAPDSVRSQLTADYEAALLFVEACHPADLAWIRARSSLVKTFDDFFEEYVYVIIASGFRGSVAARLTPALVKCRGDFSAMILIFKNEAKCRAMSAVYEMYCRPQSWLKLRQSLVDADSLLVLPRIGEATKFHLARNIGLCPNAVKPDVHLVRYAESLHCISPSELIVELSVALQQGDEAKKKKTAVPLGAIDFVLWVWLSHGRGAKRLPCCDHGYRIR